MKCTLTILILVLIGLLFWTYRSRMQFAFKAMAMAYAVLMGVNLLRVAGDGANTATVVIMVGGMLAIWLVGWLAVTLIDRYRQSHPQR